MSSFLAINWADVGKGFLIAFLTVVVGGVLSFLNLGVFPSLSDLGSLAIAGLAAGIAYLAKNFLTNSENKLFSGEPK